MTRSTSVTHLLKALQGGRREALDELLPLIYEEMHALARRQRRKWQGDYTLNTTALVHEAFLKLVEQSTADYTSCAHFLAVASKAMRHLLVDYARKRGADKRGGPKRSLEEMGSGIGEGVAQVFGTAIRMSPERAAEMISLDRALERLAEQDERACRVVECRFFGGMTIEETATALSVSPATVKLDWAAARGWLYQALHEDL